MPVMKKKILILEDDADILDILSYLLSEEGYETHTLANGENIWEVIKEFAPDLVLTDLMLGDIDGRSICRGIKENPLTSDIPVILISARGDLSRSVGEPGGPDDFISKPFDINYLIKKIGKYV
jgi:DNA-binding response OmpR family regulator